MTSRAAGAVEAVERIVHHESEADEILRGVVATLADRYAAFAGIRFVEDEGLVLGPAAGAPSTIAATVPVRFREGVVAELVTSAPLDEDDERAWQRIAALVSPYCLVGWDTGGEGWEP